MNAFGHVLELKRKINQPGQALVSQLSLLTVIH
jgi:hypothetical protein